MPAKPFSLIRLVMGEGAVSVAASVTISGRHRQRHTTRSPAPCPGQPLDPTSYERQLLEHFRRPSPAANLISIPDLEPMPTTGLNSAHRGAGLQRHFPALPGEPAPRPANGGWHLHNFLSATQMAYRHGPFLRGGAVIAPSLPPSLAPPGGEQLLGSQGIEPPWRCLWQRWPITGDLWEVLAWIEASIRPEFWSRTAASGARIYCHAFPREQRRIASHVGSVLDLCCGPWPHPGEYRLNPWLKGAVRNRASPHSSPQVLRVFSLPCQGCVNQS